MCVREREGGREREREKERGREDNFLLSAIIRKSNLKSNNLCSFILGAIKTLFFAPLGFQYLLSLDSKQ